MKWIRYIWILLTVYLVCSARTCTEDEDGAAKREEKYIMSVVDSVKHAFMSDSLSDQALRSFETTAIERLNDFTDYLKIVSDTTLELKFRQQAFEVAGKFFIPGEIEIQGWSKNYLQNGLNTYESLGSHLLSKGMNRWAEADQITVRKHFMRKNDSTYAGNLSFYQKWFSFSNPEKLENISGPCLMDIYLIRTIKAFGEQKPRVWDVYLGKIEQ
jgi:hypothetical protein